jgi:hypothetical protein
MTGSELPGSYVRRGMQKTMNHIEVETLSFEERSDATP